MPERGGSVLTLASTLGQLQVTICTERIVRVRLLADDSDAGPSYVATPPDGWPGAGYEVRAGNPTVLSTGALVVRIELDPLNLVFEDGSGTVALRAPQDEGVTRETVRRQPGGAERRRTTARFTWTDEQHFYGLGEGGHGFERTDTARQLWNSHFVHGPGADIGVPLLLSTRGYGLFFDNSADAQLVVGRSDGDTQIVYRSEHGPLDWYFLYGGDMRGVLAEVANLLGRAPMPPRWSLGFLQSTRHFEGSAELRGLPRQLRERRIPCDAIVLLSSYGDALGWNRGVGHLEFQPTLIPEPTALLEELGEQGFHLVTHEYPVVHEDSPLFAEARELGYLLDEGYERVVPATHPNTNFYEGQRYIDFSKAEARAWWWARHHDLTKLGVAGWWLDGGEGPSSAATLSGGDGLVLHNIYDRLRHQGFAEGEARDRPELRPYMLCRSGAAGMQRYGAGCWSGDINNSFATLEAQVPLGLNTGLSGIPYWGTDIGGFFHPQPESGELYARWFQFGAFCAGFRAHGYVWREHLPWAHGPEVESICRRYVELRYRLLPYTYTLTWQAHTMGLPPMRPLVLQYAGDPAVWELGSEYLWGDDLLVAPVTRQGATAWPVYLPRGVWYDFWTQQRHEGPAGLTVDAPLDRLPLFARGGAILPLAPPAQFDGERPWDEITLLIYPEGQSRFEFYEDDGRTSAYQRGGYAITPIECRADSGQVVVRVGEATGDHAVIPANRTYILQLRSGPPSRVSIEGVGALPERGDRAQPGPCYWHDGDHFTYVRTGARSAVVVVDL
ncbi:MAG: Alpha-glucosidase [Chloroflexi bacterium]|nr:Alpha-glucosidase [Chloroflexota bacterium]